MLAKGHEDEKKGQKTIEIIKWKKDHLYWKMFHWALHQMGEVCVCAIHVKNGVRKPVELEQGTLKAIFLARKSSYLPWSVAGGLQLEYSHTCCQKDFTWWVCLSCLFWPWYSRDDGSLYKEMPAATSRFDREHHYKSRLAKEVEENKWGGLLLLLQPSFWLIQRRRWTNPISHYRVIKTLIIIKGGFSLKCFLWALHVMGERRLSVKLISNCVLFVWWRQR